MHAQHWDFGWKKLGGQKIFDSNTLLVHSGITDVYTELTNTLIEITVLTPRPQQRDSRGSFDFICETIFTFG